MVEIQGLFGPIEVDASDFDVAPNWYFICLHISAAVTIPINLIGLIIVFSCQKKAIGGYRWPLFYYQLSSTMTDILLSTGTLPVIYSPFPIGTSHGWLNNLFDFLFQKPSVQLQSSIVFASIFMTALGVEILFFYRYQVILPYKTPRKLRPVVALCLVIAYQLFWIIFENVTFYVAVPEQTSARQIFRTNYPSLSFLIEDRRSLIVSDDVTVSTILFLTICFIRLGFGIMICGVCVVLAKSALDNLKLSQRTKNMHLKLIQVLCYQVSIPVLVFYLPLVGVVLPLIVKLPQTQTLFHICALTVSYHTFLGTFCLLFFNRPYRSLIQRIVLHRKTVSSKASISKAQVGPQASHYF